MKKPLEKVLTNRLTERDLLTLQAIAEKRETSMSAVLRDKIKELREEGAENGNP